MHFSVKNNTIISRACFYEADGARIRGCVQVEEGDDFTGEICYCDTDDCNQQTCDHRYVQILRHNITKLMKTLIQKRGLGR